PTLPEILPTTLKRPTPSAANTAVRALVDIYETKVETFVLKGVGGLHAALYKVKAPFEEMGYGVNEQGLCTQYQPQYPSPTLQMQPAVKDVEMRMILGEFEPGLKTIGDGAFWPWTVQLFFDTKPVKELELPPEHPEGLFMSRSRRYPFRITSTLGNDADEESTPRKDYRRSRRSRSRGARRKRRKVNSDGESVEASGSGSDNEDADGDKDEDDQYSSPSEHLRPIIQSRKRRLHKKASTTPHIHRAAFNRRFISSDKRALDERDVEIRNSLHSKRACWSKIEDQLLLACRVASLFLVGHTREYVCIPSNIVRNIMHDYFPIESRDKTSYACSRRLKFLLMLRNDERTQTDILLTKVSSDTELMAKYHIGKSAWVHLYNRDSEQAHHLFKDLVQLIVKNFLPTIAQRCAHMLNKSLLIPSVSSEKSQQIALENQNNLERIREMLLKSREALRSHYDFILLASVHSEQTLPDIGQSRSAIVVETLRNFFLGALRLRQEINSPHDLMMLNRILKQYPYEEMTAAVKCLATTDAMRKQKSFEDFDLNIIGHFRLKTTLRLTSWCNLQLFINIRFFMEAWSLYKQCSEETRRLREKQRRNKAKPTKSALADTSESSQVASNEWIITKHDFAEPTSGGLVATFTEFLYCKSQVQLRVHFDMSCISILQKPCMSLEDRKRCLMSGSDFDEDGGSAPPQKKSRRSPDDDLDDDGNTEGSSTPLPYGPSTHIGMTVKLLKAEGKKHKNNGSAGIKDSLLNMYLDVGSADEGPGPSSSGPTRAMKGKTPRIDIRLSLNGGCVEAVAPSTSSHVTVVSGEPEHKKLCKRVLSKFLAPLNWDAAKAKELTKGQNRNASTGGDDKLKRMLEFILGAGELGRTLDQMRDRFSDSRVTIHTLRRLMDDQKVFLVGLNEPRFVHWAHLRLWLVHVRNPKLSSKSSSNNLDNLTNGEAANKSMLPVRMTLAVNPSRLEALEQRVTSTPSKKRVSFASFGKSPTKPTATSSNSSPNGCECSDYYFIPQPWISESGAVKSCFFTHLLLSICSFVSRLSGGTMDYLAKQYRNILSPVSFRILCMMLFEIKALRITRVVGSKKCSLFSKLEPVIYLGDQVYLAPASELSVTLEPNFLSRMNALIQSASELLNIPTPDAPETMATTYDRFARCRAPRSATILVPQQPHEKNSTIS
ncbi:unnamed protein product, partial [Hymenolepis diminuta]